MPSLSPGTSAVHHCVEELALSAPFYCVCGEIETLREASPHVCSLNGRPAVPFLFHGGTLLLVATLVSWCRSRSRR
jgi:hypothetical protein